MGIPETNGEILDGFPFCRRGIFLRRSSSSFSRVRDFFTLETLCEIAVTPETIRKKCLIVKRKWP
jgi:hypothetical protein